MASKKIDDAIKQQVILAHGQGIPRKRISETYGISLSSVGRIIREKQPLSPQAEEDVASQKAHRRKRIEDLERRITLLEQKILYREQNSNC